MAVLEHQRNHLYIEELKRTATELDEKITKHLRQLADLRKDILAIPSSGAGSAERQVRVEDVLSFAKYISPTTVPPTFRKQDAPLNPANTAQPDMQMTNGIVTPSGAQEPDPTGYSKSDEALAVKKLNEAEKAWLDPVARLPFEPWPSHEVISVGTLADIQKMIERGEDPASVLSAEEQAEADGKRRLEEERERAEEAERERRRMSLFDTARRRNTMEQEDVFNPDD